MSDLHSWANPTPAWQAEFARQVASLEAGLCPRCGERLTSRAEVDGVSYARCPCNWHEGMRVSTQRGDNGPFSHGETLLTSARLLP